MTFTIPTPDQLGDPPLFEAPTLDGSTAWRWLCPKCERFASTPFADAGRAQVDWVRHVRECSAIPAKGVQRHDHCWHEMSVNGGATREHCCVAGCKATQGGDLVLEAQPVQGRML